MIDMIRFYKALTAFNINEEQFMEAHRISANLYLIRHGGTMNLNASILNSDYPVNLINTVLWWEGTPQGHGFWYDVSTTIDKVYESIPVTYYTKRPKGKKYLCA